jgi:hypothetical protein
MRSMNKSEQSGIANAYKDNAEPLIEEMLRDPIVLKLMESDNVSTDMIDRLREQVAEMRARLASLVVQ